MELVAESWTDEVGNEKHRGEYHLLEDNEKSHQNSRFIQSQHGKEVEPFIVWFLQ